jgi:IS5 family transposase
VIVDAAVPPKAVAFPTDAKLMRRARELRARLAKTHGVRLRQSDARVGKRTLTACQRYAHAKPFRRANRACGRTSVGCSATSGAKPRATQACARSSPSRCGSPSACAISARTSADGKSLRCTPECIGKGKAHRPYEFGVKGSVAATLARSKGGQFIAHGKALPGNPEDGHPLKTVIPEIAAQVGASLARIVADRGDRGPNAPPDPKIKVSISGQKRGVADGLKRDLRRRSAVEPVIGHAKGEHRMGRNFLKGAHGDASNAVLAAAGDNFRRRLAWLAALWRVLILALIANASNADLALLNDA